MPHYGHLGKEQGDMKPHVESYQKPEKNYPEHMMSKTTEYVERRNKFEAHEAGEVRKQHYKGRYS